METKDMLYIVTEYAKNGEMFGEWRLKPFHLHSQRYIAHPETQRLILILHDN